MDSLTLSRHFFAMMNADDHLCFSPCLTLGTKVPRTIATMAVGRLPFPRLAAAEATTIASPCSRRSCSVSSGKRPHASESFLLTADNGDALSSLLQVDDQSFCQDERNLSFPSINWSEGDDHSQAEITDNDSSTSYGNDSSGNPESQECSDVDDDSEDDDSSFSELSYDGVEFDFGYATYKAGKAARLVAHSDKVVVEVPEHIRREMCLRRDTEAVDFAHNEGAEQPNLHVQMVKVSQARRHFAQMRPQSGSTMDELLRDGHRDVGDVRTTAPTMPRRRDSISAASTIDDDDLNPPSAPHASEPCTGGTTTPSSRIPLDLQRVFLQSQAGGEVDVPPSCFATFQEFRCRDASLRRSLPPVDRVAHYT